MSRTVYLGFPTGEVAGGQKMILRRIETLRELGFGTVFWLGERNQIVNAAGACGPA